MTSCRKICVSFTKPPNKSSSCLTFYYMERHCRISFSHWVELIHHKDIDSAGHLPNWFLHWLFGSKAKRHYNFYYLFFPNRILNSALQQRALLGFSCRLILRSDLNPDLHLWRTLYRLSYSAAATAKKIRQFGKKNFGTKLFRTVFDCPRPRDVRPLKISIRILELVCSTCMPLARTKWFRSTFSSHCPLSSNQRRWLTSAIVIIFPL